MPTPATVHLSPKSRFQQSQDNLKKHHALVDSNDYARGVDFALLEYQSQLALKCSNDAAAHGMGVKITGVLEYLEVFKRLADVNVVPTHTRIQDHLPEMPNPLLSSKGN